MKQSHGSKKIGWIALFLCFFLLAPAGVSADEATDDKALGIRDSGGELHVDFSPAKPRFQVGEAIRFNIRGNRDFFLYLFSINEADGSAVLLIPGSRQEGIKYRGGRTFVVPNPGLEFFANRPGTEKVVMLASSRYLDMDRAGFKTVGDFYTTTAKTAQTEFKALQLRSARKKAAYVIRQMDLDILPASPSPPPPPPAGNRPIAFISTDLAQYRPGDVVRIVYGADAPGWVHIYTIEPDGRRKYLTSSRVSGEGIYHLKARAESPTGRHALLAVFGKKSPMDVKSTPMFETDASEKGLSLIPNHQPPFAVCRFSILEY